MTIAEERQKVIAEAASWEWTPFHWHAQVKGPRGGCDCGSLLKGVYETVGLTIIMPPYSRQFFLHSGEEIYLKELDKHCVEIEMRPEPGDIVVYKIGKAFGHAGIVFAWPTIIHSCARDGYVMRTDGTSHPELSSRERKYFSLKKWHE